MRAEFGVYPELEPYATHRIPVAPPHELHVEECGTPDGLPALFLHGGPGGGVKPAARRTFDPDRFRVVLFDQRGCGKSTPGAELDGNDTDALIADIETIREALGIERWLVTGGSWGSFLSLAYAIAHPERCLGLRLHGVFLGSPEEVRHWFHGIGRMFPEAFADFAGHVPEDERGDLLPAYYKRLVDPDPAVHMPAAEALRGYSARSQTLLPSRRHIANLTEPQAALAISRIFTHYCTNGFFRPEGALLAGIPKIAHLPCEIVQGRYDVVTPPGAAWSVAQAWPGAKLTMVGLANHVATEEVPDLNDAIADATDRLADLLAPAHPSLGAYYDAVADSSPAISPDGSLMAFASDETGLGQLWTCDLPDGTPSLRLSTEERVGTIAFRPGTRDILFSTDYGGDERHQFWLLPDGAETPEPLLIDPRFVHNWGCFDATGARIAWSSPARDPFSMDVQVMDLATRERRTVMEATGWRTPKAFSPDGSKLLVEEDRLGMHSAGLTLIDLATGAAQTLIEPGDGCFTAIRWAKDGQTLYLATNHGAEYVGIAALDLSSRALTWVLQPEGDVEQMALTKDNASIIFALNERGVTRLASLELATGAATPLAGPPAGRTQAVALHPDGTTATVAHVRFTAPPALWRVALDGGPATPAVKREGPAGCVEPVEVMIPADGAEVPAFLYEPVAPKEDRPALVWVHGGPESQYAANWRPALQYLINRGWTVLAPNVRGSTGYGRSWQAADDRINRMVSVRDLKAVRDWLRARPGIGRIGVGGESYGGFMTLSALTEYPDDWDVGVDIFGFVNFITELEYTAHYRRTLRAVEYGDPSDPAEFAFLRDYSPSRKMDAMTAPLFIAHGQEDPRVPPNESEAVLTMLKSRGHPCEIVRIPHEGHGFKWRSNAKRVYGAMTAFLVGHLGTGL